MCGQNPIFRRTRSATRHAVGTFLVGTDGTAGNALIEFAIIAPLLVVMCIYVIDFGFFSVRQMELNHATQVGAQYAIEHGYSGNGASISSAVTNDADDSELYDQHYPERVLRLPIKYWGDAACRWCLHRGVDLQWWRGCGNLCHRLDDGDIQHDRPGLW